MTRYTNFKMRISESQKDKLNKTVGNHAIKKLFLKIENHEKIAMLAVSSLNTISSLISKVLSDDSISDEEYFTNFIGV